MASLPKLPPLHPFRPRALTALRGYNADKLGKDLGAGITVAVVALPLAMAFAIASGLKPEAGLWTAIIGGFLVSALGGTQMQIGGPAGAFIVIVYGIVERYGVANLLIATACAGVILFLLGLFRLGTLVRYIPVTIVIGFTNGIAVLIALSQVKDWLGLDIAKMPGDFFSQIKAIAQAIHSFNPWAFALGTACVIGLFVWPRLMMGHMPMVKVFEGRPVRAFARLPAPIVALVTLSLAAWYFKLPVETIGTRFGSIPQSVPAFALPAFSWETVRLLVVPTLTIAMLGAIESLLCARVADQLASGPDNPVHDPNQELMGQGVANFVVPFFGGMPVTGTIARTVTNIRSGAVTPVAGMVHAIALAAVVLLAAPLALHIPLAVLAGVLLFVAYNMGEWHEFVRMRQFSAHYRLVVLGTFLLTIVFDLTVAVELGLITACLLFVRRMNAIFTAKVTRLADGELDGQLYGTLFFGAAAKLDPMIRAVESASTALTVRLDCDKLLFMDTSGLDALQSLHRAVTLRGGRLVLQGLHGQPESIMQRSGFEREMAREAPDTPA
jgi:SulP family sulfate permease